MSREGETPDQIIKIVYEVYDETLLLQLFFSKC